MPVKIRCPNPKCGKTGSVADDHAGQPVCCPRCLTMFPAPASGETAKALLKTKLAPKDAAPTLDSSVGGAPSSSPGDGLLSSAAPAPADALPAT